MKKQLLQLLFICFVLISTRSTAQVFNIGVWSQGLCMNTTAYAAVTVSAPLATSYTWITSGPGNSQAILSPTLNGLHTSITYTSCGTHTIYCFAYTTNSIQVGSVMYTVNVSCNAASPVTITAVPNTSICLGSIVNLSALGGITYSWAPGGMNFSSIMVSPTVSTCYTVMASNAFGCIDQKTHWVILGATAPVTATAIGNWSVCMGSSITYSASGANSYTWNTTPPVYTSTLNVIPSFSAGVYGVSGTGNNGCTGWANVNYIANPFCAEVWPGDANRDGVVSNTDVLELGLAANNTGPARTPTSNAWNGQYAAAWTGTVSSGWNKAHADCNGDGIINASDNAAITQNFGLTHSFKENHVVSANPDIHLVAPVAPIFAGTWNKADIHLGDANNSISQVYGIAYEVAFDQGLVQTDSVKIIYTPSFLNASNQNIDFGKVVFANSKLYAATVRVDHGDVSGNGKIGEFWYKVSNTVPLNSVLNLSIANAMKVNSAGVTGVMSAGSASVSISNSGVGLNEIGLLENSISIYPNPASRVLTLQNTSGVIVNYSIVDVLGRDVVKGSFIGLNTLDISALEQGVYLINFEDAGISVRKKLIIEKQ